MKTIKQRFDIHCDIANEESKETTYLFEVNQNELTMIDYFDNTNDEYTTILNTVKL